MGASAVVAQPPVRRVDETRNRPDEKITFWLEDGTDSWRVPLPNWSLEDVMRTIDARDEEQDAALYSIQSVAAKGFVEDGLARLTIDFELEVAAGTARVPLGLAEGVYIPTPEQEESGESRRGGFSYEGPGFCALDVDSETGEYVAIVQSPPRRFRRRPQERNRDNRGVAGDQPAEPASEQPSPEQPAEPSPEQAAEPASEQPAEPASEQAAEPASKQPAESAPEQPAEPAPEQPAEPASEQPAEPAPEQPAEPAPEQSAEPSPEQPAEPSSETDGESSSPLFYSAESSAFYASSVLEPQESSRGLDDAVSDRPLPQFQQYKLRLELCFCVDPIGRDEYRLSMSFPPSVSSLLTLDVPTGEARVSSVKGAAVAALNEASDSTTQFKLHGLGKGGERCSFVWRRRVSNEEVVYQVENALIDVALGARETIYDASLPIRAFGGDSREFYVRLPDGATLDVDSVLAVGAGSALFSVKDPREVSFADVPERLKAGLVDEESANSKFAIVQLEQPTSSVVVKLRARAITTAEEAALEADATEKTPPRLLSGFGVLGAQKQNGQVMISCAEGLDFDVSPSYGASRDADVSNAEDRESYSFYAQPFLLKAQAFRRQATVNVKPEYQATVRLDGIALHARFKYSIYGMKATELRLRLHGWKFRSDDANEILDLRRAYANESSGEHVFPLRTPSDGVVVFDLYFFLETSPDEEGAFSATLPTPTADWVEQSALVVTPVNNAALTVLKERCFGLEQRSARSFSLELEQPKSTQEASYFQVNQIVSNPSDARKDATLCATVSKLEQKVDVTCVTEAFFSERGEFSARQTFGYDVANEPLEEILIQAPRALVKAKTIKNESKEKKEDEKETKTDDKNSVADANVKFTVDGKPALATLREDIDDADSDSFVYAISLSEQPRIGSFVVGVQYDYQSQSLEVGATNNRIDLYLTQPYDSDQLRSNTLRVSAKDSVYLTRVATGGEDDAASDDAASAPGKRAARGFWRQTEGGYLEDGTSWYMLFQSTMPETFIRFAGGLTSEKQGAPVVERAWIQTWYSNAARYDDAFYRARCEKSALTVRLPDGTLRDRVAVLLNDKPFDAVSDPERGLFVDENTLRVPIPEELRSKEFTLELSYMTSNKGLNAYRPNGRCFAQLPTFDGQTWVRRAYWQVIVPNSRHIVSPPKNWSSEYVVKRDDNFGFFRRVASTNSDELYEWIGVEKKERPDPSEQDANAYLFSSFNYNGADESNGSEIRPIVSSFYLATRSALILFGSGVTLAIGLGLLYFPGVRSPLVLFLISLVALAFSAFQPTLALIFLPTTVLGIVLTLATAIVAVAFGRRFGRSSNSPKRANESPRVNSEGA